MLSYPCVAEEVNAPVSLEQPICDGQHQTQCKYLSTGQTDLWQVVPRLTFFSYDCLLISVVLFSVALVVSG